MCDTFIALADVTVDRSVIFGKNSDRPAGEIQDVVTFPAQSYSKEQRVQCTYIEIPQVERTYAVILSKPRWMWGAEMGANECGVAIGNEAVWTTQPCQATGLLGFDFAQLFSESGVEDSVPPYSREGRVRSALRSSASLSLCQLHQGKFALDTAKSILRDHHGHVCMHGDFETRGSQISKLSSQQGEHWFIDRPFPCQQDYKLMTFPTTTQRKYQPVEVNH